MPRLKRCKRAPKPVVKETCRPDTPKECNVVAQGERALASVTLGTKQKTNMHPVRVQLGARLRKIVEPLRGAVRGWGSQPRVAARST